MNNCTKERCPLQGVVECSLEECPYKTEPKIEIKNALEDWVSPVELIYEDAKNTFFEQTEEHIMARVESTLGVKVDRDELIKAMNYDREQYRKGFENGYKKRNAEIIRCKDCIYNYGIMHNCEFSKDDIVCTMWETDGMHSDDFCSSGERIKTE